MPFPTTLTSVEVQYFSSFCGRGQPIHLFLEDAGIPYTIISDETFHPNKANLDLYPFNQMPVVIINGGEARIAQQDAILRYFAKVCEGYWPPTLEEEVIVDMLGCAIEDFVHSYQEAVWSENHAADLLTFAQITAPKLLAQFEHLLSKTKGGEGTFVSCANPSFPEFTLFHLLSAVLVLRPSLLSSCSSPPFPLLGAWFARMNDRPRIRAYLSSGRRPGRLNYLGTAEVRLC